jgi:hypothetical protein
MSVLALFDCTIDMFLYVHRCFAPGVSIVVGFVMFTIMSHFTLDK